jgi:hypothetical protein
MPTLRSTAMDKERRKEESDRFGSGASEQSEEPEREDAERRRDEPRRPAPTRREREERWPVG